jgi:hypothetical protein
MLMHYPNLDQYILVIIPLASIRNYKKVIKINLTTALNSEIYTPWCTGFLTGV